MQGSTIKYEFVGNKNTSLYGIPARAITEEEAADFSAVQIARIEASDLYLEVKPKEQRTRKKPKDKDVEIAAEISGIE
jgi:hypothetical protein